MGISRGDVFAGRYRVGRLLGSGAYGAVYEARHEYLARDVALKVLESEDDRASERLRQEGQIGGKIRHPGFVQVLDGGRCDQGEFLAMELLRGRTLRAEIDAGTIAIPRALDVAIQIARALRAAHAQGVVHRDIKPENIFCCDDGSIRVLDLGVARWTSGPALSSGTRAYGTLAYVAPEYLDDGVTTPAADQYALAHVTYEMLAGFHAYGSPGARWPDDRELIRRLRAARPTPLTKLVPGTTAIWAAISVALAPNPQDRHQDMAAFGAALERVRTEFGRARVSEVDPTDPEKTKAEELRARYPTPKSRSRTRRRPIPVRAALAAGLLAVSAIAAAGVALSRAPKPSHAAAAPPNLVAVVPRPPAPIEPERALPDLVSVEDPAPSASVAPVMPARTRERAIDVLPRDTPPPAPSAPRGKPNRTSPILYDHFLPGSGL